MRGSSAIKNFSMLVFRITSVITLQGEQSKSPRHRVRERRARIGATQSRARGEGELTREGRSSAASARRAAGAGRRTMSSHRPRLLHRWRAGARRPHPAASSATSPTATPRLGLDRSPPLGSIGSPTPRRNRGLTYLRAVQEAHHAFASMDTFFFYFPSRK